MCTCIYFHEHVCVAGAYTIHTCLCVYACVHVIFNMDVCKHACTEKRVSAYVRVYERKHMAVNVGSITSVKTGNVLTYICKVMQGCVGQYKAMLGSVC